MARTRFAPKRGPANINFDLRRTAAAKNIERGRRKTQPKNVKIKMLMPESREIEVKKRGQVIRRMTVRRKTIFPPKKINHHRTYG